MCVYVSDSVSVRTGACARARVCVRTSVRAWRDGEGPAPAAACSAHRGISVEIIKDDPCLASHLQVQSVDFVVRPVVSAGVSTRGLAGESSDPRARGPDSVPCAQRVTRANPREMADTQCSAPTSGPPRRHQSSGGESASMLAERQAPAPRRALLPPHLRTLRLGAERAVGQTHTSQHRTPGRRAPWRLGARSICNGAATAAAA